MNYLKDVTTNMTTRVGFIRGNPPTRREQQGQRGRATLTTTTYGITTVGSPAPGMSTYVRVRTARIGGGAEKIRGMPNVGGRPNNGDSATSLPKSTTKTCWTLGAMSPEWEAEAWEATKARCKRGDNPHTNRNKDNHNPVRDRGGQSPRASRCSLIVKTTRSLDASSTFRASKEIKQKVSPSGTRL